MSGGRRRAQGLALLSVLALLLCGWSAGGHAAGESQNCTPIGRIVSIQGAVKILRAGQSAASYVRKLDTALCQGDLLQTDPASRAALLINPETVVRLDQNTTVSVSQTADETVVEFTQDTGLGQPTLTTPNPCGAGYFITRFPRRFRVLTPFVHASVEGTEFLVAMRCESAQVSVFEGRLLAQEALAAAGQAVSVKDGESFAAGGPESPAVKLLVKPIDAVQWALYYPPISEPAPELGPDQRCNQPVADEKSRCLTTRAEQRLRVGRVNEALDDIRSSLALVRDNADADALLSVIAVVKNDKLTALNSARRATQLDPVNPRTWIALSYAQQASFDLDDALRSAERAAELSARSSTAQARVAELLMSLGRIKSAERSAQAAVEANPTESRAHTILGFVHLAQIDTRKARADFVEAIERDSSDPLPRLGLGLVVIRDGDLGAGREQIEIAVALDPTNSLLRSYVGKAYYEENTKPRDEVASTQFGIAKQLDPKDPTPWFYDALLKQTQNRPLEALEDLQRSLELNDNRAVYRSRLLLDEDRASRSISLAQIYRDAGFEQLALAEAFRSLNDDPHSYASHRFLAQAYEGSPTLGVSRSSEQMQSLLRAPVGTFPVSPFRGVESPAASGVPQPQLPRAITPLRSTYNSYEPLFERPGVSVFGDAVAATQDTLSSQAIVTVAGDTAALSAGYGKLRTDGFGMDRDLEQEGTDFFAQVRPSDRMYVQMEFIGGRTDRGVVQNDFDPMFRTTYQLEEDSTTARVGGRYEITPSSIVYVNAATQMFSSTVTDTSGPSTTTGDAGTAEAQYSYASRNANIVVGGGHLDSTFRPPFVVPFPTDISVDTAYAYARFAETSGRLGLHIGLSCLTQENLGERMSETSPKLGASAYLPTGTTIRLAAFQTVRRPLILNETLEPTQFVGFNQFWNDPAGSTSQQGGIGVDQRLGRRTFAGAELIHRDIGIPLFLVPGTPSITWREKRARAYLYHAIPQWGGSSMFSRWSIALSADFLYEEVDRPEDAFLDGVVNLRTQTVPLAITVFPNERLSVRAGVTYFHRSGLLWAFPFPGVQQFDAGEEAWLGDVSLTYHFPGRHGRLAIGVSNLSDNRLRIIDADAAALTVPPEQVVFARLSLTF